jgi:hypothetical protein
VQVKLAEENEDVISIENLLFIDLGGGKVRAFDRPASGRPAR